MAANSSTNVFVHNSDQWCTSLTGPIYLYGHLIPGIALFIFGLTFNPIALYYFSTSRHFRRSAYSHYFSAIAIVDLIRLTIWGCFLLLDNIILKLNFHPYECSIQTFTESVASSISAWLTVSLTLERCLVIFQPLQTFIDSRGKRARIVIVCVALASCIVNALFLWPRFYGPRMYRVQSKQIVCYYEENPGLNTTLIEWNSFLTPDLKRAYQIIIIVFRVAIPFILLLTANIVLFVRVHQTRKKTSTPLLVRHGRHQRVTPMIFFSSCILLLTISPRYLLIFYLNFLRNTPHCFLTHHAPHLLKTLELFSYSSNVFVSIVSGKHGRQELFDMLLCRTSQSQSVRADVPRLMPSHTSDRTVSSTTFYEKRLNNKNNHNPLDIPLLSMTNNHNHSHRHYRHHHHQQQQQQNYQ